MKIFKAIRLVLIGHSKEKAVFGFTLVNLGLYENPAFGLRTVKEKKEPELESSGSLLFNIYQYFDQKVLPRPIIQNILSVFIFASIITSIVWLGPKAYYLVFAKEATPVEVQEDGSSYISSYALNAESRNINKIIPEENKAYQPDYDESLPEGNWIAIPKIGVRSELQADVSFEEALLTGVWQVPDFGDPENRELPMIVAAHRFGWKWWWQDDYWRYHSFYLLPKLETGDTVEVIYNHRKWIYEIYAGGEGQEITDYNADLILYTCKYLDSPVRIFEYARLVVGE